MPGFTRRELLMSLPLASGALAQPAPLRVRSLNHFGIAVADPKRTVEFYQGLFGLPIAARSDGKTILRIGVGPQFLSIGPLKSGESPRITHYCMGVQRFSPVSAMSALTSHAVTTANVAVRKSGRQDLIFPDPDDLECQLQDVSYCGGTGLLGNVCGAPEASPRKGLIELQDISHLTIFCADAARTNKFYQDLFGFSIRSYQGPKSPTLAIGPALQFLMFASGTSLKPGINHACMTMEAFKPDVVINALERFGLKPREKATSPIAPLRHYITMRMENRGGAKEGTPELYFTDPDGILMQLQDTSYCGGSGVAGNVCPSARAI